MNLTGQTLGDYTLESIIGHGPRATIYRARQLPVERIVAVKVYDESIDPDLVRQAVEAAEALTQANVLPVYGAGAHRGLGWVAMRHMPVGSIKSRWRGVAPLADLARMLPQMASALDHAHDHGLLHLNLKPSNILIDHPGNAFVADFGLPSAAQTDSPYAAPEAARGGQVDARADVYALGAVLYEMVTGRAPIARRPRDDDRSNARMANLPLPRSVRSDIPEAIEAVVLRAMSIDPEARYATPGALAEAFAQAIPTVPSVPTAGRAVPLGWIALGAIGLLAIIGVIVAAGGSGTSAAAPTLPPSPTAVVTHIPTLPYTPSRTPTPPYTPTSTRRSPTVTPTSASTLTPTPTVTPARVLRTATPVFKVTSLALRPFVARLRTGSQLDLYFDAVVQSSGSGPFGQLYAFLPVIDSLVTTRIGAQVYAGSQLLHVTLIVDCLNMPQPVITDHIILEIRPNDRGRATYSQTIAYSVTWCR